MRLLLITDFFPPFIGGAEQAAADTVAELAARGHTVAVATLWHAGLAQYERFGDVQVFRLKGLAQQAGFLFSDPARRFHPPCPDPLATVQIRRVISWFRPDIVQGQSWMLMSAMPLRRRFGFKTVAVLHDYAALCPKKTLLLFDRAWCPYGVGGRCLLCAAGAYGALKGTITTSALTVSPWLVPSADVFVAISSYVASVHQRLGHIHGKPVVTIPDFVRDDMVSAPVGPPLPDLPSDYILFLGALGRHKGIQVLLDAYMRLQTKIPLVMIGMQSSPALDKLPSGVMVTGALPHAKVTQALDHARFLVIPSLWPEPFGIVAIEAMARGKAVVASRSGGLTDIVVDNTTGLLVTPGDAQGLAAALDRLLNDPTRAEEMGQEGRNRCSQMFTASRIIPSFERVYARLGAIAPGQADTALVPRAGRLQDTAAAEIRAPLPPRSGPSRGDLRDALVRQAATEHASAAGPMRILMVSDFYPPFLGGLERHVQSLSRELVAMGHSVSVATLWHDDLAPFEVDAGVRIYRLKGWHRILKPFHQDASRQYHPTVPDPGIMAELREVVAKERPDILHARGWMLYSVLPLVGNHAPRLVVTLHDYGLVCCKKTFICSGLPCSGPSYLKCVACGRDQLGILKSSALAGGLLLSRAMHERVARYIAISSAVREASIGGSGVRPSRISVVPTMVPDAIVEEGRAVARPAFLPAQDGYILFVGNLSAHKGLDVLFEAYDQALASLAELVVIGIEPAGAGRRYPAGVTVAVNRPHAEVMAAWRHCSVGVVPSIWPEPFGQVAIEAMVCGCPVVASAIGGLRDAIADGETGLLVPPGDPLALRQALRALLEDPSTRARFGEAGRQRAQRFFASTVVPEIEHVYREVLVTPLLPSGAAMEPAHERSWPRGTTPC